jgi:hypothetical protein
LARVKRLFGNARNDAALPPRTHRGLTCFSRIGPGSSIAPHVGPTNLRLRRHLGITVPDACGICGIPRLRTRNVVFSKGCTATASILRRSRVVLVAQRRGAGDYCEVNAPIVDVVPLHPDGISPMLTE